MMLRLACVLSAIVLLVSACSSPPAESVRQQGKTEVVSLDDVERISVLTTDGQEIPLNAELFSEFAVKSEANEEELHVSSLPLPADEVRFTVVVYRRMEAPLVIEVGPDASQVGDVTYRGVGAERFYRWVRESVGRSLFRGERVPAIEAVASDMLVSAVLEPGEAAEVWSILQQAEYREMPELPQYPLYPRYLLKLKGEGRETEVTVLTPSLLAVRSGKEVLHFAVTEPLFSRLIKRIPPQPDDPPFDPLFKATVLAVQDRSGRIGTKAWKVADSIAVQGAVHELVRLFKQSVPVESALSLPDQATLILSFKLGGRDHLVRVYPDHLEMEGAVYAHPGIETQSAELLARLPE